MTRRRMLPAREWSPERRAKAAERYRAGQGLYTDEQDERIAASVLADLVDAFGSQEASDVDPDVPHEYREISLFDRRREPK